MVWRLLSFEYLLHVLLVRSLPSLDMLLLLHLLLPLLQQRMQTLDVQRGTEAWGGGRIRCSWCVYLSRDIRLV